MHRGEDTAYYLAKGYRVVGFEADPELAAECAARFAGNERLTIVEGAIAPPAAGDTVRFHRHPNRVWGTIDAARAASTEHGEGGELVAAAADRLRSGARPPRRPGLPQGRHRGPRPALRRGPAGPRRAPRLPQHRGLPRFAGAARPRAGAARRARLRPLRDRPAGDDPERRDPHPHPRRRAAPLRLRGGLERRFRRRPRRLDRPRRRRPPPASHQPLPARGRRAGGAAAAQPDRPRRARPRDPPDRPDARLVRPPRDPRRHPVFAISSPDHGRPGSSASRSTRPSSRRRRCACAPASRSPSRPPRCGPN